MDSSKVNIPTLMIAILATSFLFAGIGEALIISNHQPAESMTDYIQPIGSMFSDMIPGLIAALVLCIAWYKYCQRTFQSTFNERHTTSDASIDDQIAVAQLNLASASSGTAADRVFFAGIVATLASGGAYAALVFTGLSPVRSIFF